MTTATLSRQAKKDYFYKRLETLSNLSKETTLSIGTIGNADIKSVIIDETTGNSTNFRDVRKYGVKRLNELSGKISYIIILPHFVPVPPMQSLLYAVLLFVEVCRCKQLNYLIPHFNIHVWEALRRKSLENLKHNNKACPKLNK